MFDVITVENIHSEIEQGCKRTDEEISCKYRPFQYAPVGVDFVVQIPVGGVPGRSPANPTSGNPAKPDFRFNQCFLSF